MKTITDLKKIAESHQHIRYYTESPELKEDVEYFTAFSPKTVLNLISALEKYEEALRYMEHRAETDANTQEYWYQVSKGACVSVLSENVTKAREALTQVQKIMEGK